MARPTLGPAYGNTDRSTSPRLMGGTPDISSQAPIATQELAAPGIQAVARMVETFSQPGQGPTIGGPLQISAPPRLGMAESAGPARLPRPVDIPAPILGPIERTQPRYAPYQDNMGAMARALSGFSTFFKDLETYAVDREKRIDTAAKAKGSALAQEVSQGGFFSSLQDAQKHLEKGVAQGLPGYDDLLRRFQAADPRALRYATLGMQDAYVKNSLATLQERISQTRTLLDGRPLESVNANEPAFQQMMTSLAFPNGTQGLLPEVWEANRAQLSAIYGTASASQEKRFGEYKTQKAKEGLAAIRDGNAAALVNNTLPPEQIAENLGAGLDGFYNQSGQTAEEYRKELEGFAEGLLDSVLLSAGGDWGKEKQALGRLPEVLAQIRIGPAQAGDKRPLLLDSIGGVAALNRIMQKAQQKVLDQQNLKDQLDGREAQEQADLDIQQLFPPDVLGSPASIDAAEESALARGRQIYADNPEAALAYEERVRKHAAGIRAGFVQPVQEQNEVNLWAEMAQNPNVDYTERILQLQQGQLISQSAAKSFLQAQGARNREDNKANYQVLRGLQEDLKRRLEAQYARGSSEGGANLTPNEAKQLWQTLGELYKSGDGLIRQNPGADMTRQLGDLYGNALSRSLPQQVQQPPATATPEALARDLGGNRGDAQRNAQLRRQAETQPLYSKDRMGQQLDTILSGSPLDDSTRLIIRRSGMKPSDFFTRQMQLHGIPLDTEIQKRLKELDGGDLVSQAGGGTSGLGMLPTNRYLPVAQRLGQQFANGLMNLIAPPAQAAGMPTAIPTYSFDGGTPRPFGGSGGMPYVNQRASLSGAGDRECFSATSTMIASAYLGRSVPLSDYNRVRLRYGDSTSVNAQVRALQQLGVNASVADNGTIAEVARLASGGKPVAIGIQHGPRSSHWIVVTGVTANGDFIVNDPFGKLRQTKYGGWEQQNSGRANDTTGQGVVYGRSFLQSIFEDRGAGTGRIMRVQGAASAALQPAPTPTTRRGGGMTGLVTYYTGSGGSDGVAGGPTANGEIYDPNKMTAAVQWSLRGKYLNKWLIVEDLDTGRRVRVWANDTGSMGGSRLDINRQEPRIIDLSPAAFRSLAGSLDAGVKRIRVLIDKNQRRS